MSTRSISLLAILAAPLFAQPPGPAPHTGPQPIYRVTIVQRTTPAINYAYRNETTIDFRGTPLMPQATGNAVIKSERGATLIDAHFKHVPAASNYGSNYLTYVVWAVSPDGRAQSVGELIPDGSDKAHLRASTPFQAFALIVTAEPYYSVARPSSAVVMENAIAPETIGEVQSVNATYELLPRETYTYSMAAQTSRARAPGPKVSMPEYEALLATYEAQKAINVAIAADAARYAPERLNRAQTMFNQARQLPRASLSAQVVSSMREVAQIADDARAIAMKRADDALAAQQAHEQKQIVAERMADQEAAQQAREQAERARAELANANAAAEQARQQEEALEAARARQEQSADRFRVPPPDNAKQTRAQLRSQLNACGYSVLDTPRGLVVVVPDFAVEKNPSTVRGRLGPVASAVAAYRGLRIEVDGNELGGKSENANYRRSVELANSVRAMLIAQGVNPARLSAYGYGSTRPTASNETAAGRQQNRRVEIVIAGPAIGSVPVWEQTYSLQPR